MKFLILFFASFLSINAQVYNSSEEIKPLLIGSNLPSTVLYYPDGSAKNSDEIFENKKTILVVYRGGWCPFCNAQLSDLAKIQDELIEAGYQIVAISPDTYEDAKETLENIELEYLLLSDKDTNFIQGLGIAFMTKRNSILPVPAVYFINEKKEISFEYINPNYTQRFNPNIILAIASHL